MSDSDIMSPQEQTQMFQHYEVLDRYAICSSELIRKMRNVTTAYQAKPTEEQKSISKEAFSQYEEGLERLSKETSAYFTAVCRMMDSTDSMKIYGITYPDEVVTFKNVSDEYRMRLRRLYEVTFRGYYHFVNLEVETIRASLLADGTIEVTFDPHVLICSTIHSVNGRRIFSANLYGGEL